MLRLNNISCINTSRVDPVHETSKWPFIFCELNFFPSDCLVAVVGCLTHQSVLSHMLHALQAVISMSAAISK